VTNEYRDPLAGLRSQIVYKRGAIEMLCTELTPVRRLLLNPDAIAEIDRQRKEVDIDAKEEISALSECLRRADALEVLLARAVERAKELATLPDDVPKLGPPPWQIALPFRRLDMSAIVARLVAPYGEAAIAPWGNAGAARFVVNDHPLRIVARGMVVSGLLRPRIIALDIALMTAVPPALPDLSLHVELPGDRMISTLRLSRSRRTGDRLFDDTYFVSGDEETAKVLLTEPVRRELLTMSPHEARVRIGGGLAEIGWTMRMHYESLAPLPKAAIDFVVALRDAIARG
jgi:hypothetical protein